MVAALGSNDYFPPPMASCTLFWLLRATVLPLALVCLAACNLVGKGDPPPRGMIYYPTALTLSSDNRYLFVVNSNFDRRFSSGSVQSYDLDQLAKTIARKCPGQEAGISCEIDPTSLVHSEILLGSLGRDAVLDHDGKRLLIPTQADGSLTYVNVGVSGKTAGEFSCGGQNECSNSYLRGLDKHESPRELVLPPDPVAMTSVPIQTLLNGAPDAGDGNAVIVAHRNGKLSLFVDVNGKPTLVHILEGLSSHITAVAFDPESGLLNLASQNFADTLGPKFLQRVGVAITDDIGQSYLFSGGTTTLRGIDSGEDTWSMAFGALPDPDDILVLAQRPDSLLQAHMEPDGLLADVRNIIEVGNGASRMVVGTVMSDQGPRTLAVISCISERRVFVIDAINGDVLSIIPNFSGPFVMALDTTRARLYVSDFRTSTIRIVDLEPVLGRDSARILATLGRPRYVQELK